MEMRHRGVAGGTELIGQATQACWIWPGTHVGHNLFIRPVTSHSQSTDRKLSPER